MDPNLQDTLKTIIDKMEKMDQQLREVRDQIDVNCRNLATWLDRLKINRRRATEEDNSQNGSRSPRRERDQSYYTADTDAQYIKSIKVDAPSFDGRFDPQVYINWQLAMDRYFRWHNMFESRKIRKIRFAVMKLTGQAGQYWEILKRMIRYRREDPVETWEGMKEKLILKYVSLSFSQQLLDKWNRSTHRNKSATDYIAKFDEYLNRCGTIELSLPNKPYLGFGPVLGMITAENSSLEAWL